MSNIRYVNYTPFIKSSHKYAYVHIYFAWEDQKRKQCYIVHTEPLGVKSAI